MKVGRNDPCFCGSGKKYKKCCLGKSEQTETSQSTDIGTIDEYSSGIHPCHIARICSDPDKMREADLTKKQIQKLLERWNPDKLRRMQTEEILERLAVFGVNAKKDAFVSLADVGYISAWKLGRYWMDNDVEYLPAAEDEDFVCFAACELWKRYLPERPSVEMVDDWVHEAYDLEEEGKQEDACELYQRVWKRMLELFTPEMQTLKAVDPVFNISQFFLNWIQDYEMCLENLIAGDNSWLKIGIPFAEQAIQQFSEEEYIVPFYCDLGRWLIQDGRTEEGEAELEKVISSYPDRADGYISLIDARNQSNERYLNTEDVIQVLERAKAACPQNEIDAWDIERRLADFAGRVSRG